MIVTTCAANGQAHKGGPDRHDHVIQPIVFGRPLIVGLIIPHPQAVEAGGDDRVPACIIELIPGELLQHEAVVGLVVVEAPDHVVPVAPGIGLLSIPLIAVGLRKAHHVQPVPSPALTVLWFLQQPVNHPLESTRSVICNKALNLLVGRRKTDEVEIGPPDKLTAGGRGRRLKPLALEPGKNKPVYRTLCPGLRLHLGQGKLFDGTKRPPVTILVGHLKPGLPAGRSGGFLLRPGRAQLNPAHENTDLVSRKLLLGRHLQFRILVFHRLDEQALPRLSGHNSRTGFSPGEDSRMPVETELPLLLLRPMALVAAAGKKRANLPLEKLESLPWGRSIFSRQAAHAGKKRHKNETGRYSVEGHPGRTSRSFTGARELVPAASI